MVLTPSTALPCVCPSPYNAPALFCSWHVEYGTLCSPLGEKLPSGGRSLNPSQLHPPHPKTQQLLVMLLLHAVHPFACG